MTQRPKYPLNKRLGASQSLSEDCGEETSLLTMLESTPRFLNSQVCSLVNILITLS